MAAPIAPAPRRAVILGCGYVGAALAGTLLADGGAVGALTRNRERAGGLRALGADPVVTADLAGEEWHDALDPADAAVVCCVSPSASGVDGYRHSFETGIRSLARWLEKSAAAGRAPAGEILFTSSTRVYTRADGGGVDEDTPVEPAALDSCGAVLRAAEQAVLALPAALARRAWVLRLGGIYGPGRHHLLDLLRAGRRVFPGRGEAWINLIHRDDAVAAIRACLAAPPALPGGIANVVDGSPVSRQDLLAGLAGLLGIAAGEIRCDASAAPLRGRRPAEASGPVPNRRVAGNRLKQLGWRPNYPSFSEGFRVCLQPPAGA